MYFEGRELNPYAEPVSPDELKQGEVYFAVSFVDDSMLIPILIPTVFVGKDLDPEQPGLYFQDIDSYGSGVRFGTTGTETEATFDIGAEKHTFEYEKALDVLMQCALRRRKSET
jgi:hypothetical protein